MNKYSVQYNVMSQWDMYTERATY